jgi:iron complex transport system substrate-binding protein
MRPWFATMAGATPCRMVALPLVRLATCAAVAIGGAVLCAPAAAAGSNPRIASINVCTDQLLLALADPEQIVGLSPFSRDAARSWAAAEAGRYRRLSGEAEDVLVLKPDLVVAGAFTRRATRELLKDKGVRVVEFEVARSLQHAREQIRRMAELTGHPERGDAQVARLDAAVARARAAVSRQHHRVLPLSRRGWVSGTDSLVSSMLAEIGLSNAADSLGLAGGGFASLETIVSMRPDFILVAEDSPVAEDQGQAFLLHPALERLYPPARRLVVPERLTVCGGPMLAEALERLTAEIARVSR